MDFLAWKPVCFSIFMMLFSIRCFSILPYCLPSELVTQSFYNNISGPYFKSLLGMFDVPAALPFLDFCNISFISSTVISFTRVFVGGSMFMFLYWNSSRFSTSNVNNYCRLIIFILPFFYEALNCVPFSYFFSFHVSVYLVTFFLPGFILPFFNFSFHYPIPVCICSSIVCCICIYIKEIRV